MAKKETKREKPFPTKTIKTNRHKEKFLNYMKTKRVRGIASACRAFGISPGTVGNWKRTDPKFREALIEIQTHVVNELEESAISRAIDGWDEPIYYQGVQCGTVRKFSSTLTTFMLKALRPDVYFLERNAIKDMEMSAEQARLFLQEVHQQTKVIDSPNPSK